MVEFRYARGRLIDSIRFISEEIKEFQQEYAEKTWREYQEDKKLQKLMDRTIENILTALIELCGTFLTEKGVAVESYGDALRQTGKALGFSENEQEDLVKLSIQRNRLAHRSSISVGRPSDCLPKRKTLLYALSHPYWKKRRERKRRDRK